MMEEQHGQGRFFLVSVPELSFMEWTAFSEEAEHSFLSDLMQRGIPGAMNVRTPYHGLEDIYLSIGAGAPASATSQLQGFRKEERFNQVQAGTLYERYTGNALDSDVVVPHFMLAHYLNEETPYMAVPGLLGEVLARFGIERWMFGSLDGAGQGEWIENGLEWKHEPNFKRYAPLLLMDTKGTIPYGNLNFTQNMVSDHLKTNLSTDYHALLEEIQNADRGQAAVYGIELGDLYRLYEQIDYYSPEYFMTLKNEVLSEMGSFLERLALELHPKDRMLLFSPSVPKIATEAKMMLTPVIYFGPSVNGDWRQGEHDLLLSSDSTRRKGLITYADLAPTILHHFQIEIPSQMNGSPLKVTSAASPGSVPAIEFFEGSNSEGADSDAEYDMALRMDSMAQRIHSTWTAESSQVAASAYLQTELKKIQAVYQLRFLLLYSFVIYEVIVLLAGLIVSIKLFQLPRPALLSPLLVSLLWAPVVMLWSAWLAQQVILHVCFIVGMTLLLSIISTRMSLAASLLWASGLTAGTILIDGFTGGSLIGHSVLGYDPMIGARYYGIGNEYMGVLIGAFLLFCAAGLQHLQKQQKPLKIYLYMIGLLSAGLVFFMVHPRFGANAGGTITALAVGGWFCMRLAEFIFQKKVKVSRMLLLSIGIVLAGGGTLWFLNAVIVGDGEQSHIGNALQLLGNGDYKAIAGIITRKVQMNLHLIGVSSWSKVFITSLFILALGLIRPLGIFKIWQKEKPMLVIGFSAIALGAIIALIFNDSGIVAAATMIIYAVVPMLLLQSQEA